MTRPTLSALLFAAVALAQVEAIQQLKEGSAHAQSTPKPMTGSQRRRQRRTQAAAIRAAITANDQSTTDDVCGSEEERLMRPDVLETKSTMTVATSEKDATGDTCVEEKQPTEIETCKPMTAGAATVHAGPDGENVHAKHNHNIETAMHGQEEAVQDDSNSVTSTSSQHHSTGPVNMMTTGNGIPTLENSRGPEQLAQGGDLVPRPQASIAADGRSLNQCPQPEQVGYCRHDSGYDSNSSGARQGMVEAAQGLLSPNECRVASTTVSTFHWHCTAEHDPGTMIRDNNGHNDVFALQNPATVTAPPIKVVPTEPQARPTDVGSTDSDNGRSAAVRPVTLVSRLVSSMTKLVKRVLPTHRGNTTDASCKDKYAGNPTVSPPVMDIVKDTFKAVRKARELRSLSTFSPDGCNARTWAWCFDPITGARGTPNPMNSFLRFTVATPSPRDYLDGLTYWLSQKYNGVPLIEPTHIVAIGWEILAARQFGHAYDPTGMLEALEQMVKSTVRHSDTSSSDSEERWHVVCSILTELRGLYAPHDAGADSGLAHCALGLLCLMHTGAGNQGAVYDLNPLDMDVYSNITQFGLVIFRDILTAFQMPQLEPCKRRPPVRWTGRTMPY